MAKFEEVLPALREGKKIRRKGYVSDFYLFITTDGKLIDNHMIINDTHIDYEDIFADDWEIYEEPKQKVPYYPALVKIRFQEPTPYYEKKFQTLEEATQELEKEQFMTNPPKPVCKVIRLIKEIPELIEWRDE